MNGFPCRPRPECGILSATLEGDEGAYDQHRCSYYRCGAGGTRDGHRAAAQRRREETARRGAGQGPQRWFARAFRRNRRPERLRGPPHARGDREAAVRGEGGEGELPLAFHGEVGHEDSLGAADDELEGLSRRVAHEGDGLPRADRVEARRGDLHGLRRDAARGGERTRRWRADGREGPRQERTEEIQLPAVRGSAREGCGAGRRRLRHPHRAPHRREGTAGDASADLRPRHQGADRGAGRHADRRRGDAHVRLAERLQHLRRRVRVPRERDAGDGGLRLRARLHARGDRPVPPVQAVQVRAERALPHQGRQDRCLRREGDSRGRFLRRAETLRAGRADRRRRGGTPRLPPHQGRAHRVPERTRRRRGDSRERRRGRAGRGLFQAAAGDERLEGDEARAERARVVLLRHAVGRDGGRPRVDDVREVPVVPRAGLRRGRRRRAGAARARTARARGGGRRGGLSPAAGPADGCLHVRHDPRRGPAVPPEDQGSRSLRRVREGVRLALHAVLSGRGVPPRGDRLQIDFSNCLHCKTCRIKCPKGNIDWTFPQGGDGPRYTRM